MTRIDGHVGICICSQEVWFWRKLAKCSKPVYYSLRVNTVASPPFQNGPIFLGDTPCASHNYTMIYAHTEPWQDTSKVHMKQCTLKYLAKALYGHIRNNLMEATHHYSCLQTGIPSPDRTF